ncbi:hypothetical protein [Roseovarius halotolerans]|uniref:hypothetical protein n=1 Tax=Roseovarius halotolerans TaxID=505353 RepID=UPI00111BE594|nr:hypothetical protein [Roseovarius halotolerans]
MAFIDPAQGFTAFVAQKETNRFQNTGFSARHNSAIFDAGLVQVSFDWFEFGFLAAKHYGLRQPHDSS